MPTYQIDDGSGKTYEVDASSPEEAWAGFSQFNKASDTAQNGDQSAISAPMAALQGGTDLMAVGPTLQKGIAAAEAGIEHFLHPDTDYNYAYNANLQSFQNAKEQHPTAYAGGQIGGNILAAIPAAEAAPEAFGVGKGMTATERLIAGGATNAAIGGTDAAVRGGNKTAVAEGAGEGALGGMIVPSIGEISSFLRGPFMHMLNPYLAQLGLRSAQTIGGKMVGTAVGADQAAQAAKDAAMAKAGVTPNLDQVTGNLTAPEMKAADAAGLNPANVDMGDVQTRKLLKEAGRTSEDAASSIDTLAQQRAGTLKTDIQSQIKALQSGEPNADMQAAKIKMESRVVNRTAYAEATKAGNRPIWNKDLAEVAQAPDVQTAMNRALKEWDNYYYADNAGRASGDKVGQPSFATGVTVTPDGKAVFSGVKRGVQNGLKWQAKANPNIQFWDYTRRELSKMAQEGGNANDGKLASRLNDILDNEVPQYKDARGIAASYFKASDAIDAGQKAMANSLAHTSRDIQNVMSKMTDEEKSMFRYGAMSNLYDRVEQSQNPMQIFRGDSLNKMRAVLGDQDYGDFMTFLKVKKVQQAIGGANSAVKNQLATMGIQGGMYGAAGAYEGYQHGGAEGAAIGAAGAVALGALNSAIKSGGKEKIAEAVSDILTRNDPDEITALVEKYKSNGTVKNLINRAATAVFAQGGNTALSQAPYKNQHGNGSFLGR